MSQQTTGFSDWYKNYSELRLKTLATNKEKLDGDISNWTEKLSKDISRINKLVIKDVLTNSQQKILEVLRSSKGYYEKDLSRAKSIQDTVNNKVIELEDPKKLFKKLMGHPRISSVIADGIWLSVSTRPLMVRYKTKLGSWTTRSLGRFEICVSSSRIGQYQTNNLDYSTNGNYDHYHVQDGIPCLSSYERGLVKADAMAYLFLVIDGLIHFLLTADSPGEYHCPKGLWFSRRRKIKN